MAEMSTKEELQAELKSVEDRKAQLKKQLGDIRKAEEELEAQRRLEKAQAEADRIVGYKVVDAEVFDANHMSHEPKTILLEGPEGELVRIRGIDDGRYTTLEYEPVRQCPKCGGTNVDSQGQYIPSYKRVSGWGCDGCGHWWSDEKIPVCGSLLRPHMVPRGNLDKVTCIQCGKKNDGTWWEDGSEASYHESDARSA